MSNSNFISITEARKKLFQIADKVQVPGQVYTLTEKGKPKVVVMSVDEFDSWRETLEIMIEFPNLKKEIEETKKAFETGEYKNWTALEDLLAREGYILADRSRKYEVSTVDKTKSTKRARKTSKS